MSDLSSLMYAVVDILMKKNKKKNPPFAESHYQQASVEMMR